MAAAVTGLAGLAVAVWAHRRGGRLAGVVCCALTGLLISPMSWTHHWVWEVPLLVWLAVTAWQRRTWLSGLAAAACAAVFSGLIPIPWPGHPPDAGRMLASDLYLWCGLVVLAGTALALARARRGIGAGGGRAGKYTNENSHSEQVKQYGQRAAAAGISYHLRAAADAIAGFVQSRAVCACSRLRRPARA